MAMDLSKSVSIQPAATTTLLLLETTTSLPNPSQAETSRPSTDHLPVKVQSRRSRQMVSVLNDIVVFVWIGLRAVSLAILLLIGFLVLMALSFASVASIGSITMLTGNGILRAAHLAHYTNNASAAFIGTVGSLISVFILALFTPCVPKTYDAAGNEKAKAPWYIQICAYLLLSTLSGTIGSALLLHSHVDLGGIDILHATRAGALGGAILGPGVVLIAPAVFAALFLIFSPVWLAISMSAQLMAVKSSEDWRERRHSYSYCYCCGSRGDDPEINAELANGTTRS